MNKKQYNNIIRNTLKQEHTEDSLSTARAVFKNMGIALPNGVIKEVFKTVKTNDYMGWKPCTMEEARAAANKGTAAIGISDSKIVVLAADDAEEPIESTAEVLAITDSTPAVAVAWLQYYSYGYGRTGCGGITTTISTEYCGGSNYRDVTKHKMVLQCDGYYVCSKCGYRVKSPALEDRFVLSEEDYYKVKACYLALPYYAQIEKESHKDERMKTNTLLAMIDDIRRKSSYKNRYEFSDSNGKCKREYTTENQNDWFYIPTTINKIDITDGNILIHNGLAKGLLNLVAGFFISPKYSNLFTAITIENHYDSLSALLSDLAKKAGYWELGMIVNLVNLGSSANEKMNVGDKLVKITLTVGAGIYVSEMLFSCDGNLKAEYHSVK